MSKEDKETIPMVNEGQRRKFLCFRGSRKQVPMPHGRHRDQPHCPRGTGKQNHLAQWGEGKYPFVSVGTGAQSPLFKGEDYGLCANNLLRPVGSPHRVERMEKLSGRRRDEGSPEELGILAADTDALRRVAPHTTDYMVCTSLAALKKGGGTK